LAFNEHLLKNWQYYLRIYSENSLRCWDKTILSRVESLAAAHHSFCEVNEQLDPDLIKAFGTATPPPGDYLLHLAPGWDRNLIKRPVLLVHGSGLDNEECYLLSKLMRALGVVYLETQARI
jgi:hypothetical protein